MSIEIELKNLLEKNGYVPKSTKNDSIWTYENNNYGCSIINYHKDDTIAFNYLAKYMRDMVNKRYGKTIDIKKDEKEKQCHNAISSLPFYESIKRYIPTNRIKWNSSKGIQYFSISSKVGMDVLSEIVRFIVSDCGGKYQVFPNNSKAEKKDVLTTGGYELSGEEYNREFEIALRQIAKPGEKVPVSEVENQMEKNMAKKDIYLSPGWRKS